MASNKSLVSLDQIERKILLLRGEKVMLDSDLADLYGVETKRLNEAVKRNIGRFPEDFMFQLTHEEYENLKSQIATSSWGGRRTPPYAFTELGVAMLSSVLNSERAVSVNISIMRAFVRLRRLLSSNAELARRLAELESRYDSQFQQVFEVIRRMMQPGSEDRSRRIGFRGRKDS